MKKEKILKITCVFAVLTVWLNFYPTLCLSSPKWINKNDGLSSYKLSCIAIDKENPKYIYLGAKGLILKSSDNGLSWRVIYEIPKTDAVVRDIEIHPANPRTVYAATDDGLFKTISYGKKWERAYSGLSGKDALSSDLHIDKGDYDKLFLGTANGLVISADGSATWQKAAGLLSGKPISFIAQHPGNGELYFVSEASLFRSADGGMSLSEIFSIGSPESENGDGEEEADEEGDDESPRTFRMMHISPAPPYYMYLASSKGLYISADEGDSWNLSSSAALMRADIRYITSSRENMDFVFLATDKGVFRISPPDTCCEQIYSGLTSDDISFVASSGAANPALWAAASNGLFVTEGDIFEPRLSGRGEARAILDNFSGEPTCAEVRDAAIFYAEVHPKKIEGWRKGACAKALLPTLSVGLDQDRTRAAHWDSGANPDTWVWGPDDEDLGWDISASWDLGDLVWSTDQTSIDVRSKLMVQLRNDIVNEVTRLYFERRKLQIELMRAKPKDEAELIEKELRVQELTANIDGLTGGYFSKEIEHQKKR